MQSAHDKKLEKLDPFYRRSLSKQKTSAEIISEARNALRTVRTQRPFTPREDQRKLFGPASSRTADNRPPSSFSLHASSFESSDSRPISGTRLSPLELKPKVLASLSKEDEASISFPKPPVDPVKIRRVSSARARLFKASSQGNLLPDKIFHLDESKKKLKSEDIIITGDSSIKINGICLTELNSIGHFNSHNPQLTYDGDLNENNEQAILKGKLSSTAAHLRSGSDLMKRRARASSCPVSTTKNSLELNKEVQRNLEEIETEPETEEEEAFWSAKILPVLHDLEKEDNIENFCAACTQLHQALEEGSMLGKRFKKRNILLKTLYKLVDVGSDLLSLKLAKIILALKVSGKNLLNVCKLIFKISRSEKNDSLIQNDSILDSLLEVLRVEDLQTNNEAFLYCMGAIKFISGNPRFLNEMINKGAVEILLHLMKQINENMRITGTCFSNSGHLLVQLTATIRNLVDLPSARCKLLSNSALPELCGVMEQYANDKDVCTNVARILSKLSSYHDCCAALADYSRCYALFLSLINQYEKKQDLVVRIVFILGNLTAKNNQAREQFAKEKGCIKTLLSLFSTYYEMDLNSMKRMVEEEEKNKKHKQPSEVEDVLIKVIRVLANISIHPTIGAALAANQQVVALLVTTLEYKSIDECEELVINATATINNLSFYQVKNSIIQDRKLRIAELLLKLLMSSNMDGILEAVRVFGNLSQYDEICDFIVQKNVYKFMIALLDAKHQDVCFSACGVLLNLTVDKDKRVILKEGGGIKKLVDCLRDFGPTDWQLACLVCKTLWNYSENVPNPSSCFGDEDTNALLVLLSSFLDEELALDYSFDRDLRDYHKLYWETEFKPVAQQLLKRIQSHHTFLEPLPIPSF
ncbi:armadillo repeat-containing protein 2 [Sarcophilus harrisii]|uniref:Armadillo repeat containing 2 n=1 Tax=Sarcophilus harrisii TaxID=9305 RepID=A0A7N4NNI7_SARHA|nr:armadillo repeat-containing protein 2 [Sarcophilus harrisii]XP_031820300.1 armadillo repeat-containing protein 2 [Sarcophilus harrisii]XP_031820301.1 armadillo repeat-containing protein 2 [Sarcophilus harrisii]XP_031820302.1 armadillo repeat-containing protein 2 [Sarcophilus harrisii]